MIEDHISYIVTFGDGKTIRMRGNFLRSALRDASMDIASWQETEPVPIPSL
jgi:hypothetical protein